MSMADGETRSRTNQPNAYDLREPPPGPMYSSTPPRGPQPGNGKTVRGPIHASGVDWTLTLRRKLDRSGVPAHEADALAASVSRVVTVEADREIVREDDEPAECARFSWMAGLAGTSPWRPPGPRSSRCSFPGTSWTCRVSSDGGMEHVVASLTPCRVALIPHDALRDLMERRSGIGRLVHLETAVEPATARRRRYAPNTAPAASPPPGVRRFAHLICELFTRAAAAGIAEASRFPCR